MKNDCSVTRWLPESSLPFSLNMGPSVGSITVTETELVWVNWVYWDPIFFFKKARKYILMCNSCHIRHLMKCPNWCRTWNICFLLIFSWKMLQPNFAFWDIFMLLRCLNSKEIKLQSSIRVICIIFNLILI